MAQGEFTKEEAKSSHEALSEMFEAIPKSKRGGFLGHLNDISLFISAAAKVAPTEAEAQAAAKQAAEDAIPEPREKPFAPDGYVYVRVEKDAGNARICYRITGPDGKDNADAIEDDVSEWSNEDCQNIAADQLGIDRAEAKLIDVVDL